VITANSSPGHVAGTAVSGLSVAHSTSGANRLLVAGVGQSSLGAGTATATYNSVSLTQINTQIGFGGLTRNTLLRLIAPATGSNTLACTLSKTEDEAVLGAVSYTDVHQTTPLGTAAKATSGGNVPTVAVTSAHGELVTGFVYQYNSTDQALTVGAGQTERWENEDIAGAGTIDGGMSDEVTALAATSVTFSYANAVSDWTIIGVSIKPAAPTVVPKTIKSSGGDYASLALLEAANADLVLLNEVWEATWDNLAETTGVTFTGWVTDSTRYLKVSAANAHGSVGRITTNASRLVVNGTALTVNDIGPGGFVWFKGIQIQSTSGSGFCVKHSNNGTRVATVRYEDCVFVSANVGVDADGGASTTNDSQFITCSFLCVQACIVRQYRDMWLYGCTCISTASGAHGVNWGANDGRTKVAASTYARSAGGGGSAYNSVFTALQAVASDTTGSGSGTVDNVAYNTTNFLNVTASSEDLRIASGSSVLVGNGTDRSAAASPFNYTDDIRGVTKGLSGDDIGAFEFLGPPVANFSGTPTALIVPTQVDFTDTSTGGAPTSWAWTFGSGEGSSALQNPSHTYATPGTFTVELTATNIDGSDVETKTNYITAEVVVVAEFSADETSIVAGTTVQFTDESTGDPTDWAWAFGAGEGTSMSQNPTHQYNTPGTFTVALTASKDAPDSEDTETKVAYITVEAAVVAAFNADQTTISPGDTVQFTDDSTGDPTDWAWSFGAGEGTSMSQNPTHQYNTPGTFTVELTASKTAPNSSDTETKVAYIAVVVTEHGYRSFFTLGW